MIDWVVMAIGLAPSLALLISVLGERWHAVKKEMKPDEPEIRSMKLLVQWLSPLQKRQYRHDNSFDVIGDCTGKRYRINCEKKPHNITEFDDREKPVAKWCIVFVDYKLPLGDLLLMQKLSLECDESEALRLACKNGMFFG